MPASAGNPVTCFKSILLDKKARLKDRLLALSKLPNPSRRLLYNIAMDEKAPSKLRVQVTLLLEELVERRAREAVAKLKAKEPDRGR